MNAVGIKDIARQAGVSVSMVSRVINGKSYVNEAKREKILRLINETGFVPSNTARNMVMKRSFSIAIVLPDMFNIFQRQLVAVIERQLDYFGYQLVFFMVNFDDASEAECLARIKSEKIDGLILIQEVRNIEFYEYLVQRNIPAVSVTFERNGLPSVHVDDESAAFEAVSHLINLGHRSIAFINSVGFSFTRHRENGYYRALASASIPLHEPVAISVPQFTPEAGVYGMRGLLLSKHQHTAIFAATDELAFGAIRALKDYGISVPNEVSVIGFDDIDISNFMVPRLTTIRQPIQEMGERAVQMLNRLISGKTVPKNKVLLEHRLIIRESTAVPA
jgi:LacI family transcriptional regulator